MNIDLKNGDCLEVLKTIESNTVDAIVTDPPYELGFMSNKWDSTGIANNVELWKQCLRVLKHGGYLLSFGGTRTYHRMACAIEDAGFEVRDMIEWVYGSGFPKSHNIGKAVDKLQGNKREINGIGKAGKGFNKVKGFGVNTTKNGKATTEWEKTKGTSEWEGWGTALKPAHEPICMARKPLSEKTVAQNCLKWGTGGINIDESRVGTYEQITTHARKKDGEHFSQIKAHGTFQSDGQKLGRFPANLIHDNSDEVKECFPDTKKGSSKKRNRNTLGLFGMPNDNTPEYSDGGNASRYFKSIIYQPKASKSERNKGCEGLEDKLLAHSNQAKAELKRGNVDFQRESDTSSFNSLKKLKNNHPTVKPIALMEYLIKMVTRENAVVLDPFMGSGTTMLACQNTKRNGIGIELDENYFKIAETRINK